MLTACLWKFGFAPTSPDPLWHPDGLSLFDASSALLPDPVSKRSISIKVSRYLGNLLASLAGFCNALCKAGALFAFRPKMGSTCNTRACAIRDCQVGNVCKGRRVPQPHTDSRPAANCTRTLQHLCSPRSTAVMRLCCHDRSMCSYELTDGCVHESTCRHTPLLKLKAKLITEHPAAGD